MHASESARSRRSAHAKRLVVLFVLAVLTASCGRKAIRVVPMPSEVQLEAISAADQKRLDKNCPFGAPKLRPDWPFGKTLMVYRDGFVLAHSSTDKIPIWVCEAMFEDQVAPEGKAIERVDNFRADPKLPAGERAELADYRGSGYDRGHMAPAGNQEVNETLKDETFFLSNMSPQEGDLNRKIWAKLEEITRDWARHKHARDMRIITGGFFYSDDSESEGVEYELIGKGNVAVPTHFYKIVVAKDSSGEWQGVGFVMENRGYKTPWRFGTHIKPISWIEERTGLDFMPMLDISERKRVEQTAGPCFLPADCK